MFRVTVTSQWEAIEEFEFDSREDAEEFIEKASSGGSEGLDAIVDAGDVSKQGAELIDWSVSDYVKE